MNLAEFVGVCLSFITDVDSSGSSTRLTMTEKIQLHILGTAEEAKIVIKT